MLVVSRKPDERVVISNRLTGEVLGTVTLVELRKGKVRIGFDFPDDIVIDRQEIHRRKLDEMAQEGTP